MKISKLSQHAAKGFDWDQANIKKNEIKHGVATKECEEVFFNSPKLILEDVKHSDSKEKRYTVLGITNGDRKLTLAITIRNEKIRVIMARDGDKRERALIEVTKEAKDDKK
jgi:uncharacterized DUF497 family protein